MSKFVYTDTGYLMCKIYPGTMIPEYSGYGGVMYDLTRAYVTTGAAAYLRVFMLDPVPARLMPGLPRFYIPVPFAVQTDPPYHWATYIDRDAEGLSAPDIDFSDPNYIVTSTELSPTFSIPSSFGDHIGLYRLPETAAALATQPELDLEGKTWAGVLSPVKNLTFRMGKFVGPRGYEDQIPRWYRVFKAEIAVDPPEIPDDPEVLVGLTHVERTLGPYILANLTNIGGTAHEPDTYDTTLNASLKIENCVAKAVISDQTNTERLASAWLYPESFRLPNYEVAYLNPGGIGLYGAAIITNPFSVPVVMKITDLGTANGFDDDIRIHRLNTSALSTYPNHVYTSSGAALTAITGSGGLDAIDISAGGTIDYFYGENLYTPNRPQKWSERVAPKKDCDYYPLAPGKSAVIYLYNDGGPKSANALVELVFDGTLTASWEDSVLLPTGITTLQGKIDIYYMTGAAAGSVKEKFTLTADTKPKVI